MRRHLAIPSQKLAIFSGSLLLSFFHAFIPSHWLPVLAVARRESWTTAQTLRVTLLAGLAHSLGTVLLGLVLASAGRAFSIDNQAFIHVAAPVLLIGLGVFYIYQHHTHHHFHLEKEPPKRGVILALALAMFLSPCLEIEGYFLAAGQFGWHFILFLSAAYIFVTVAGMTIWVWLALHGLRRLDWHALDHYAGLVAGLTLIFSGIALFF